MATDKDEIRQRVRNYLRERGEGIPEQESQEYQKYRKETAGSKKSLYETLCKKLAFKEINPEDETREKLQRAIDLLGWGITPGQTIFFALLLTLVLGFLALPVFLLPLPLLLKIAYLLLPVFTMYYFSNFPHYAALKKVTRSSEGLILSVLYMIVYMNSSPNLEGAVRYAASNVSGSISDDLNKVLWSVDVGNYRSLGQALDNYIDKWQPYNEDYVESIQLLKSTRREGDPNRREKLYDQALDIILDGSKERMKHFTQNLKLPVMVLNGMGILLPIIGIIMLPMTSIFLTGAITPYHLFIFYNFFLPIFLYWLIRRILLKRPSTLSVVPPKGGKLPPGGKITLKFAGGYHYLPAWIPAILVFFAVSLTSPLLASLESISFMQGWAPTYYYQVLVEGVKMVKNPSLVEMYRSLSLILATGLSIATYLILGYRQRHKKEKRIRKVEREFPNVLFQFGTRIRGGKPLELVLNELMEDIKQLEIAGMFRIAVRNISNRSMTFRQAFMNAKYGAVTYYPSRLIQATMNAVSKAAEKGTEPAAIAMKTVSRYLSDLHDTQELINDLLEETKSSLAFLAYIMAPVISAMAVGMGHVMLSALVRIKNIKLSDFGSSAAGGAGGVGSFGSSTNMLESLVRLKQAIPPELLQLIVGCYLLEISIIMGYFFVRITRGKDPTVRNLSIGRILLVAMILYGVVLLVISGGFGGLLRNMTQFS